MDEAYSSIDCSHASGFGHPNHYFSSILLLDGNAESVDTARHLGANSKASVGVVWSHNAHRIQAGSVQCYLNMLFSF